MPTEVRAEVQSYLDRVRAALADLPPSEVQDIIDDVAPQLAELSADLGDEATEQAIVERLGEPEAYAAELRAAAGYPAPPSKKDRRAGGGLRPLPRFMVWSLAFGVVVAFFLGVTAHGTFPDVIRLRSDEAMPLLIGVVLIGCWASYLLRPNALAPIVELPEVQRARELLARRNGRLGVALGYLVGMRSAWILLRALIFAAALPAILGLEWWPIAAIVLAAPAFFGSRWLARRSDADRRMLWAALPVNAFLIGVGLALLITASDRSSYVAYSTSYPTSGMMVNGNYVSNVYAFDANGKPLDPVYLYDQDGNAINLPADHCPSPDYDYSSSDNSDTNRFPLPSVDYNGSQCVERTVVPFTVAIPVTPSTTPTTSGSAPPTTTSPKAGSTTSPVKPSGKATATTTPKKKR